MPLPREVRYGSLEVHEPSVKSPRSVDVKRPEIVHPKPIHAQGRIHVPKI
jgi:hypothetical protein